MAGLRHDRELVRDERGAILVITALVMMVLLMVAAFATDLGAWYRQAQEQQRAADLGSLNGVQSYEASRRAAFEAAGVSAWSQIPNDDPDGNGLGAREELERQLLEDATNSVIGVLNAAGSAVQVTPSNPDWTSAVISDPGGSPPAESIVSFTTTDGKTVTVIRTVDLTIRVEISQEGDQYFSGFVTGAPTIERGSTATLSNCGAVCNIPVVLDPPFQGFNASGSGDGYGPLIYGDEIWAVNHHDDSTQGQIICMTRDANGNPTACRGGTTQIDHDFQTTSRPVDHLDVAGGKMYFAARWQADNTSGLACYNVAADAFCSPSYVPMFADNSFGGYQRVNVTGPFVGSNSNRLYVMAQNGVLKCVTKALAPCGNTGGSWVLGTNEWNTAAASHAEIQTDLHASAEVIDGKIYDNKIFFVHNLRNKGTLFHCWDMDNDSACWGSAQYNSALNEPPNQRHAFLRHTTGGTPTAICTVELEPGGSDYCYALSNGAGAGATPGLASHVNAHIGSANWSGKGYTWLGRRTFFGGGHTDWTVCWDWEAGAGCGAINHSAEDVEPYYYATVTDECIVGLGDNSKFFSFNPISLNACVDVSLTTPISPCTCADGTPTWGTITMPLELMSKVDNLYATVTATSDPNSSVVAGLQDVDLVATDGALDLSGVPDGTSQVWLHLVITTKLVNGQPAWTTPIDANLTLTVQPTLSG